MLLHWKQTGALPRTLPMLHCPSHLCTLISLCPFCRWLLLDEVNLAPSEVLERIAGILEGGGTGSVTLVERGDTTQV